MQLRSSSTILPRYPLVFILPHPLFFPYISFHLHLSGPLSLSLSLFASPLLSFSPSAASVFCTTRLPRCRAVRDLKAPRRVAQVGALGALGDMCITAEEKARHGGRKGASPGIERRCWALYSLESERSTLEVAHGHRCRSTCNACPLQC